MLTQFELRWATIQSDGSCGGRKAAISGGVPSVTPSPSHRQWQPHTTEPIAIGHRDASTMISPLSSHSHWPRGCNVSIVPDDISSADHPLSILLNQRGSRSTFLRRYWFVIGHQLWFSCLTFRTHFRRFVGAVECEPLRLLASRCPHSLYTVHLLTLQLPFLQLSAPSVS